jgi:hypothetical protein
MTQKSRRTIASVIALLFLVIGLVLPWMKLERFRGDTLFAMLSLVLLGCSGALYFWALRPDLLKIYFIVVLLIGGAGAILVQWIS